MLQHVFSRYLIFFQNVTIGFFLILEKQIIIFVLIFLNFDLFQMCQLNLEFIVSEQF